MRVLPEPVGPRKSKLPTGLPTEHIYVGAVDLIQGPRRRERPPPLLTNNFVTQGGFKLLRLKTTEAWIKVTACLTCAHGFAPYR